MSTDSKPADKLAPPSDTDAEPGTKEWFLGLPHSAQEALGAAYARSLGLKVIRGNKQDDPVYVDPQATTGQADSGKRQT